MCLCVHIWDVKTSASIYLSFTRMTITSNCNSYFSRVRNRNIPSCFSCKNFVSLVTMEFSSFTLNIILGFVTKYTKLNLLSYLATCSVSNVLSTNSLQNVIAACTPPGPVAGAADPPDPGPGEAPLDPRETRKSAPSISSTCARNNTADCDGLRQQLSFRAS